MPTEAEIEKLARDASNYAQMIIREGQTQLKNNKYAREKKKSLAKAVIDMREEYENAGDILGEYPTFEDDVIRQFYLTRQFNEKFSLGNCGELATAALDYIVHHAPDDVHAEVYEVINGNHVFLVIGRQEGSNDHDPATWGENAYICDPWANDIYPAKDYQNHVRGYYVADEEHRRNLAEGIYLNQTTSEYLSHFQLNPTGENSQTIREFHNQQIESCKRECEGFINNSLQLSKKYLTSQQYQSVEKQAEKILKQINDHSENGKAFFEIKNTLYFTLYSGINEAFKSVKENLKEYPLLKQFDDHINKFDKIIEDLISYYTKKTNPTVLIREKLRVEKNQQEKLHTELRQLIIEGNLEAFKNVFDNIYNVNYIDIDGNTLLHYAILNQQEEMANFLLDQSDINVNIRDPYGNTYLHNACFFRQDGVVKSLIEKGININAENDSDLTALYAAILAKDIKSVQLLLAHNVRIGQNFYENTPLHFAVKNGSIDVVELLIENGADIEAKFMEKTPLYHAIEQGNPEMVKKLLEKGADKETTDHQGKSAYDVAKEKNHSEIIECLQATENKNIISGYK